MSYTKQNLVNGMTLNASHLNGMQDAIIELYNSMKKNDTASGTFGASESGCICTFLDAYTAWCNGERFPIAFYGDSTFQGTEVTESGHTFCEWLQIMLREECGANATVYNAGIRGKDLDWGISNFDAYFAEDGIYADSKMVGIGFGINDRVGRTFYQEYKTQVYTKLETIIQKCFDRGIQPFLVTSQATVECGVGTNYSWEKLRDSNSINVCANGAKKELAEKYGIPLLDLNKATESYLVNSLVPINEIMFDHLHFADAGHKYEAEYLFSEIVSRVIPIEADTKTVVSYVNQNLRYAIPEDKLSYGGDFKVYARYNKDNSSDTKIFDAYVFVKSHPATLKAYIFDYGLATSYIKINGVIRPLNKIENDIGVLDLGLYHIEVFTGASNKVGFRGFIFNESAPINTADPILLDTMGEIGSDAPFSGMTEAVVPVALVPDFNKDTKTTKLSGKTVTGIYANFMFTGSLHIGKVDLNEYGSGSLNLIGGKSYTVTSDRFHLINIDPIELGEHETLAIGLSGDTARPYRTNNSSSLAMISTASKFKEGVEDTIGMRLRVYGKA